MIRHRLPYQIIRIQVADVDFGVAGVEEPGRVFVLAGVYRLVIMAIPTVHRICQHPIPHCFSKEARVAQILLAHAVREFLWRNVILSGIQIIVSLFSHEQLGLDIEPRHGIDLLKGGLMRMVRLSSTA